MCVFIDRINRLVTPMQGRRKRERVEENERKIKKTEGGVFSPPIRMHVHKREKRREGRESETKREDRGDTHEKGR